MAKIDDLKDIRKHMLINPHTTETGASYVESFAQASAVTGELLLQINGSASTLWAVIDDAATASPVAFVTEQAIDEKIKTLSGDTEERLNDLENLVGTGFTDTAITLTEAIQDLQDISGEGLDDDVTFTDAINTLNGDENTDGSVAKDIKDAIDALTINEKGFENDAIVLDGSDIKLDGYQEPTALTVDAIDATDTVNDAIGKLEYRLDELDDDALVEVLSGNGINVSEKNANKQTISINIKDDEKVLVFDEGALATALAIKFDEDVEKPKYIQLCGVDGEVISEFDAQEFIKDGILSDQKIEDVTGSSQTVIFPKQHEETGHTFTGLTEGHPYLFLEFSNGEYTGTTYDYDCVDLNKLIDVYTAGDGLQLDSETNHKFSIKLDETVDPTGATLDTFLTVGPNGLRLAGVQDAIDAATAEAKTEVDIDDTDEDAFENFTVTSTTDTGDGHTLYTLKLTDVAKASIVGTGFTESGEVVTITDVIKSDEEVIASALTDLDTRINELDGDAIKKVDFSDETKLMGAAATTTTGGTVTLDLTRLIIDCGNF